jgi:hypothetical protein
MFGGERRLRRHRDNDVDLAPDQLCGERGEPVEPAFREAPLDDDALSLDMAELLQLLPERLVARHHRAGAR